MPTPWLVPSKRQIMAIALIPIFIAIVVVITLTLTWLTYKTCGLPFANEGCFVEFELAEPYSQIQQSSLRQRSKKWGIVWSLAYLKVRNQRGSYGSGIGGANHTFAPIIGGAKHTFCPLSLIKTQIIGGATAPARPLCSKLTDVVFDMTSVEWKRSDKCFMIAFLIKVKINSLYSHILTI